MNCFTHQRAAATGVCTVCGRAICRECVGVQAPRLICRSCVARRAVIGFEYKSEAHIGSWPLIHVCSGVDAVTGRPKIARGIIAAGSVAVGVLALGGAAFGLFALGGLSVGLLVAVGGAALGLGLSLGGMAVGAVAVGGLGIGYLFAAGGTAFGPAVIDGNHCTETARGLLTRWLGPDSLPPNCR